MFICWWYSYLESFMKYLRQTLIFMLNSALREKLNFCFSYLQSFTKYLKQTLVFMLNSALREKSNFRFPGDFWKYWQIFHFWRTKYWTIILWSFEIFRIFPNFLRIQVLNCSATFDAIRTYQFIINDYTLFHLGWKKCLKNIMNMILCKFFLVLFMPLLTALIV